MKNEFEDYSKPSKERTFKLYAREYRMEPIYVTQEVGIEIIRLYRREWQKKEREERCKIHSEKYGLKVCRGKCSECPLFRTGKNVSLTAYLDYGDEPNEGAWKEMQNQEDPAYILNKKEKEERIHKIFDEIDPLAYKVLSLKFVDELSMEEISKIVGIPRTTLNDRIKKWISKLQNRKSELLDED